MKVSDNASQDVGTINSVLLDICFNGHVSPNDDDDLFPTMKTIVLLVTNNNQADTDGDGEGSLRHRCATELTISKTDETCASENNGSIELSATAQFNYLVK